MRQRKESNLDELKKLVKFYDANFYLKSVIIYATTIYSVFWGINTVDQNKEWVIKLGLDERTWKLIKLSVLNDFFILLMPCVVGFMLVRYLFEKDLIYSFLLFIYPFLFIAFILGIGTNLYVIAFLILYGMLQVLQEKYIKRKIEKIIWNELELVPGFFYANYAKELPDLTVVQGKFNYSLAESTLSEYRVKFKDFSKISFFLTEHTYEQMLDMETLFFPDTKIELESKSKKIKFSYQELYAKFL
jgi:hypothetical protein